MKATIISETKVDFAALCVGAGLREPVGEFKFAVGRKYSFDWCWPECKVALEQEGGIYGTGKRCPVCKRRAPGGHSSVTGIKRDIAKYNLAAELGYRVLRFMPEDVESGVVFEMLRRVLGSK